MMPENRQSCCGAQRRKFGAHRIVHRQAGSVLGNDTQEFTQFAITWGKRSRKKCKTLVRSIHPTLACSFMTGSTVPIRLAA